MPARQGTLYLIPVPLDDHGISEIAPETIGILSGLRYIIAEKAKTARKWIKILVPGIVLQDMTIYEMDKHHPDKTDPDWFVPLINGVDVGLMSEAGSPGIADPGAIIVNEAHRRDIPIRSLSGPSSITMALMGSGMNGQSFAFHGYLPQSSGELTRRLQQLERQAIQHQQAQIFIETPYRNLQMLEACLKSLHSDTRLGISAGLQSSNPLQKTRSIGEWKRLKDHNWLHLPAVFIIG